MLLRAMPEIAQTSRGIVRFGHEWAAMVPRCLAEAQKTRLLKYVEHRDKRAQMLAEAAAHGTSGGRQMGEP